MEQIIKALGFYVLILPLLLSYEFIKRPLFYTDYHYYFMKAPGEWQLCLCFMGLLLCYGVFVYFLKNEIFSKTFDNKVLGYFLLVQIFLTAKYPLLIYSGLIHNPQTIFLFHVFDLFIMGCAWISTLPLLIFHYLFSGGAINLNQRQEEKEAVLVILLIVAAILGFSNIMTALFTLSTYR